MRKVVFVLVVAVLLIARPVNAGLPTICVANEDDWCEQMQGGDEYWETADESFLNAIALNGYEDERGGRWMMSDSDGDGDADLIESDEVCTNSYMAMGDQTKMLIGQAINVHMSGKWFCGYFERQAVYMPMMIND